MARSQATAARARVVAAERERPRLRLIDRKVLRRLAARRLAYTIACVVFVLGVFAVALAQAELVEGQRQLDETRRVLDDARTERAALQRDLDRASSPHAIVSRARSLGMVRAAEPVYFTAIRPVEAG
jgi:cell division protein FtsL